MTETLSPSSSPELDMPTPERDLIKDFYLSYKFSQGVPSTQAVLMTHLSLAYRGIWPSEYSQWVLRNKGYLTDRLAQQRMPKTHLPPNSDDPMQKWRPELITGSFEEESEKFVERIITPKAREIGRVELCTLMIRGDMNYADRQRGYQAAADPNRSYFREFVLFQTPTGSHAFDTVFAELNLAQQHTHDRSYVDELKPLAIKWQQVHPGQRFMPEDFDWISE